MGAPTFVDRWLTRVSSALYAFLPSCGQYFLARGIHSWLDGPTRFTVVHSREVAVLFVDTRPVDAIVFHHDLLGANDPASFFTVGG